ncbi:hypothetical protein HK107_09865 [Parvularcula sp. ZS-1/3]|uniref:Uncharacterized protein n=1 Tax=Parvularcula mediterranea TaxID=2732508 RepID=A0A7Y3W5U2_9PROT|nr:hypothetical protein [Parvularcula mediterranea]NNU16626.1 hypothetical protein [Parvularcula mediterranea]
MLATFRAKLVSDRNLWLSFILVALLSATFGIVMLLSGFTIIDEMQDAQKIRDHVEAMTERQRMTHAWLTATVDVLYPFVYASLFAGLSLRFLGKAGPFFAIIAALAIPADLVEGFAQVIILHGGFEVLPVKAVATPIKLPLSGTAGAASIVALLIAARRRFFS